MRNLFVSACALLVAASVSLAADEKSEEVKSGPKLGESVGPFNVKDVTGPAKGSSLCYRCRYSNRPVVSIFARELDESTIQLIKQVDEKVAENKDAQLSAFVVLLTDDPDAAEKKLEEVASENEIKNVPLTIFDGVTGPPSYELAEDAGLTVLMWKQGEVKVNRAFAEPKLDEKTVEAIVGDTAKILEKAEK